MKALWLTAAAMVFLVSPSLPGEPEKPSGQRFQQSFVEPAKLPDLSVLPQDYPRREDALRNDRAAVERGDSQEALDSSRRIALREGWFPIRVTDTQTGIVYEIASDRRTVTAKKANGDLIWEVDPYTAGKLAEHPSKKPAPGKTLHPYICSARVTTNGKPALSLVFTTADYGHLDLETGAFTYEGSD